MIRRPPRSTRTDTLFPYTTLFRSRNNRLKALAVGAAKRTSALPDVPTVIEAGFPGYTHYVWWGIVVRSEEHTSELQSLMRISYAVFCLKKKKRHNQSIHHESNTRQTPQIRPSIDRCNMQS